MCLNTASLSFPQTGGIIIQQLMRKLLHNKGSKVLFVLKNRNRTKNDKTPNLFIHFA